MNIIIQYMVYNSIYIYNSQYNILAIWSEKNVGSLHGTKNKNIKKIHIHSAYYHMQNVNAFYIKIG